MNITSVSSQTPLANNQQSKASPSQAKSADFPQNTTALESEKPELVITKVALQAPEKVDLGYSSEELRKSLQEAIDSLNQQLKANGRDLSFHFDEKINRPIITVRNLQTGEVVRQIPNEEVVRMAHSIEEGKGLLFNEFL